MREQNKKEAGIVRLLFSFLNSQRESRGTPLAHHLACQGVVCYTQTDTERKSKENSLPVDDCFRDDFRGCWGDMSAPVFGALISTQQSFVGRLAAAYCGQSSIRSVLRYLSGVLIRMNRKMLLMATLWIINLLTSCNLT